MSGPAAAETLLWAALRESGEPATREALFERHAGFARNIARRHFREQSRGDLDLHDIQQLAYAGLLEAIDRYDPCLGAPFRPFAAHRISGSIRDGLMRMSEVREQISWRHRARRERLKSLSQAGIGEMDTSQAMAKLAEIATGLALGFMLEGTGLFVEDEADDAAAPVASASAYDSVVWKETVARLQAELSALPDRERTILREHYMSGVSFDNLATLLGISKGRVSQLHRAALTLLRKRMGERGHIRVER